MAKIDFAFWRLDERVFVILSYFSFFLEKKRNKKLKEKIMLRIFSCPPTTIIHYRELIFIESFFLFIDCFTYRCIISVFVKPFMVETAGAVFHLGLITALSLLN
jgi:hypothetical protein